MRNDGDWSTRKTTWQQLLRSLPYATPGQRSGEMRNADAESNFFYTVHVIVNC